MNPRFVRLLLMLTALVVLSTGQARAEMIDFGYSWSVMPSSVIAGGTGTVTLAAAPAGTTQATLSALTPALIPGATVTTSSAATTTPDQFNTPFSMQLHLTDAASGDSTNLTFAGSLKGSLTATTSTLTSTFQNPVTQIVTVGQNVYTVTIDPALLNLPRPGSTTPAAIDARVSVVSAGTGHVQTTPEPSSLLLGATAVLGFAARRMLRRKTS
jgi:hypothetical protein